MTTKERLHLLVDALSEDEASDLLHYAEEHAGGSYACPIAVRRSTCRTKRPRALRDAESGAGVTRHGDAASFFEKLGL